MYTLRSKGKSLELGKKTVIMGILNVTPDSFSDGGQFFDLRPAIFRGKQMAADGAEIIDIGGESTRPGAESVSAEEEIRRVVPVIESLSKELPSDVMISIDTNKARVAEAALQAGAHIVNSLGGADFDQELLSVVKKHQVPFVIYHIRGVPRTMQKGEIVYDDVVKDIYAYFESKLSACKEAGLDTDQVILDPGIGFGKSVDQNIELIVGLKEFTKLGKPMLIGVSRKSHLGMILKEQLALEEVPGPMERLEAGLAETAVAIQNGANIVRTHDVKETKQFITLLDYIRTYEK